MLVWRVISDAYHSFREEASGKRECHCFDIFYKNILFIRYEDLIQDPNKIIKIIQNHLQIDDNNTKNDFKYKVPKRYDSLHDNIVKSPIVNRINGWQEELNNKEIYSYESIAADLLLDNQYELIFSKNDLNNFTSKIQSMISYIKK